jgi:phospholipid-binding lipoprotein MlaA
MRDGAGLVPDWAAYPPNQVDDANTRYALTAVEAISYRDQLLEASDILDQAGGQDPYVFMREAYRQQRISLVYDGNPPTPQPDPSLFEDDPPPAPSAQPEKK